MACFDTLPPFLCMGLLQVYAVSTFAKLTLGRPGTGFLQRLDAGLFDFHG